MGIEIRENRLKMTAFQSIRLMCGYELLDSGMLKRALAGSLLKLTAEDDGNTVGMLRIVGDSNFVFVIADVMVVPEYRNRGIASSLLTYALESVKKMIPVGAYATVSLFAAPGKEELYMKAGFKATPVKGIGKGMVATVYNI